MFNCYRNLLAVTLATLVLIPVVAAAQETETKRETTTPVKIETTSEGAVVNLSPANTRIEFVGTHVGDDPKPRLGGFKTFEGVIGVDKDNGQISSIEVEMSITSIWTEFDNLTKHLMNADFFEANKFPAATFKSSSITNLGDGNCTVAGELTMHGVTDKIEFPAKIQITDDGLVLKSEFTLDRTQFGMDQMTDGVEKEVSLTVVVGQATRGADAQATEGSGDKDDDQASVDIESMDTRTVKVSLPKMT